MTDTIVYERSDGVAVLTLNNPARHNALGREQFDAIAACLEETACSPDVRVLVLTGAGEKTFCAGASLSELGEGALQDASFQQMASGFARLDIPTICALNGSVFGGGVELALSCDFRIGVEGSRMRVPAAALGLCYPLEGMQRFVDVLGVQLAKRLLVASEEFGAREMLDIGFLDQLVTRDELRRVAMARAQHLARLAPLAVRSMKRLLQGARGAMIDAALAGELSRRCIESADLQEGLAAKRDKREPHFQGK